MITDLEIANQFGQQYQENSKLVFHQEDKRISKESRRIIHACKLKKSKQKLFNDKIEMRELEQAIIQMKLNKSPGPDGIHGHMIDKLDIKGKEILLDILNTSWETGKLPKEWKNAIIIPIKKPNKNSNEIKNFRQVSLINIACKIMERIVLRRITFQLNENNLLDKTQYEFKKKTSQYCRSNTLFYTEGER